MMAAELFTFLDGFDIGMTILDTLGEIFDRKIELSLYTDSRLLYGLCILLAHATAPRLQINLSVILESCERWHISEVL